MGYLGIMMKTINGGATWSNVPIGTMDVFYSVFFLNANYGYVVGESGDIFRTIDGGESWVNDSSGTNNYLKSIFFTDSTTGYAVGEIGTILNKGKYVGVSVKELKPSFDEFTLSPNPATDKITISSENSRNEEIEITILTMRGEPLSRKKLSLQDQIELDVGTLTKGIYLVKIQSKKRIEVKKQLID